MHPDALSVILGPLNHTCIVPNSVNVIMWFRHSIEFFATCSDRGGGDDNLVQDAATLFAELL